MFRRSSSSSNIPLPKANLFGSKDSRVPKLRRSQSFSRLSVKDSTTAIPQIRQRRNSSIDRKSSTIGLLQRATPLQRAGGSSGGGLQRTTPSSAFSHRTNTSRGATPSSTYKEIVTIQKLANDKRWVAEQFGKVQNFIMSSGLFDLNVVNANNIKPPSINNFIYVTSVLLTEIFPRLKIGKENYKEVIVAQLKVLKYPGTITNSVLKTVNTMHSWPQIIGMWSWLIDKVNLSRGFNNESIMDSLEPEERMKYVLRQMCSDFLVEAYKIFNEKGMESTEELEKSKEAYLKNLAEVLGVDSQKLERLEDDVRKKMEYRKKQLQDIENLKAENSKMQAETQKMKKEIEEFYENDPIEEKELEDELQILHSNLRELQEGIDSAKDNISQLREAIRVQPCTYQEKLAFLKQIEELKKDVEVKQKNVEHVREIKNKFDHQLTSDINKIQSLAMQWNRSLKEVTIKKPFLKKLLLREKGFHDPEFLKELQEVCDYRDTIEKELVNSLSKLEADIKIEEQKKCDLEREIQECNKAMCQKNAEIQVLEDRIREVKMELEKVKKNTEDMQIGHTQQIKELQSVGVLDEQTGKITKLKKQKEDLETEVKKFGPKMVTFFVEMHNQVVTNLKEMETIKASLIKKIENRQKNVLKKQKEMIDVLKSFP